MRFISLLFFLILFSSPVLADCTNWDGYTPKDNVLPSDLVTIGATGPIDSFSGDTISVGATIQNKGTERVDDSFVVGFYLSNDTYFSIDDTNIGYSGVINGLNGDAQLPVTATALIPGETAVGSYYLLSVVDYDRRIFADINRLNNVNARWFTIKQKLPDLVMTVVTAQSNAAIGEYITVQGTVKNLGNYRVSQDFKVDFLVGGVFLGSSAIINGLDVGAEKTVAITKQIPTNVPLGTITLTASADEVPDEYERSNNRLSRLISVTPIPDLVLTAITSPSSAYYPSMITVGATVTNQGGDVDGNLQVLYELIDEAGVSRFLGYSQDINGLVTGQVKTTSDVFPIPNLVSGIYSIRAKVLYHNILRNYTESSRENNQLSKPITITRPTPCGESVSNYGGVGGINITHELGTTPGTVELEFDAYGIPDKIEIFSGTGSLLKTSGGLVSGFYKYSINYSPSPTSTKLKVVVTAPDPQTGWTYTLGCPGQTLNNDDRDMDRYNVSFNFSPSIGFSFYVDGQLAVNYENNTSANKGASIILSSGTHHTYQYKNMNGSLSSGGSGGTGPICTMSANGITKLITCPYLSGNSGVYSFALP